MNDAAPSGLRTIPGVGPSLEADLRALGHDTVESLRAADPEAMYTRLGELRGERQDPCVLYVFRCAVYFARSRHPSAELLSWWAWKGRTLGPPELPGEPVLSFRAAREDDLPALVGLLADDPLGARREDARDPLPEVYREAFRVLDADPDHTLLVAELDGRLAGMGQLSFLPHLTYRGGWRAQVEGVRVSRAHRSRGVGQRLLDECIRRARERGCHLVQLTTDRRRPRAVAFYESLGFEATHLGMKLHLDPAD